MTDSAGLRDFKAEFFKALSNPLRIAILDELRIGERGVSDLASALDTEQATISQNLAVLRNKRLVKNRKEGNCVYYSVTDPTIFTLLDDAASIFKNHLVDLQDLLIHPPKRKLFKKNGQHSEGK